MSERLSWKEIQDLYPDQWVGLVNVEWQNDANVRSAIVKYTNRTGSELLWLQEKEPDLVSFYTTADNVAQIGLVELAG